MKGKRGELGNSRIFFLVVSLILILFSALSLAVDNISVRDGKIYLAGLYSNSQTNKWGGRYGTINNNYVAISRRPFYYDYVSSAETIFQSLGGGNLGNGYNLVLMPVNVSFDVTRLYPTNHLDLQAGVLFPSSMYDGEDNPENTFNCDVKENFQISGINFSTCHVRLLKNVEMGLFKYLTDNGNYVPVYVVDISDYVCYKGGSCNYELLLPITAEPYFYYYISKFPEYKIRVWIDSVETTHFSKTALPYYVTVQVLNYYTGQPLPGIRVAVSEDSGNNIFVPLRLSGTISRAMSMTTTNSSGEALFVIAPTEYPASDSYSINASVVVGDEIVKTERLIVDDASSASLTKKALEPTTLLDNAKVDVNAMNQISNSLYIWANTIKQAKKFSIDVYTNGTISPANTTLQTGAPNVITISLRDTNGNLLNGYAKAEEKNGYLVMNPVFNSTDVGYKDHVHDLLNIPLNQEFVITPTSYGLVRSGVKLYVYDSNGNYVNTVNFNINSQLEPRSGESYDNDDLKVIINSMNVVLNSLYYAMN